MSKPKPFISQKKKDNVKDIVNLLNEYPIIGIVDMENLPAPQLQKMKRSLKGNVIVRMAKGRLIKIALEKSKQPELSKLSEKIRGMPALIFTKDNPFTLYKTLKASKSSAPAKAGQTAPRDVVIPEGKTPFAPGPIIGELGQLGIKTGVQDGKVAVMSAKTVVKEGEVFNAKVAEILTRLNILPMEVGLNIISVFEDGILFDRKTLDIDEEAYIADLQRLHNEAMNLAVKIGYASPDTIRVLIRKAQADATALADARDILTKDNVGKILAKAEAQAESVKNKANL
ncbi:MAG: 50S ribosomal protein L10 [Nanoarchaeota archaeon]|nr:50S ribosomal protein L10 [Nanoarchaeota archaeon]